MSDLIVESNSCLYLYSSQRDLFIHQLKDNLLIYKEFIQSLFEDRDLEEEVDLFLDGRARGIVTEKFNYVYNKCMSEEDYCYSIYTEGYRYYKFLLDSKYRLLVTWICCTCQLWEQQILSYLINEISNKELRVNKQPDSFIDLKTILQKHGYLLEKYSFWKKIVEMRDLVNVVKHAEGHSEKRLRKKRPDYFDNNGEDYVGLYHTSLGIPALNVHTSDLQEYNDALISFWECFPTNEYLLNN